MGEAGRFLPCPGCGHQIAAALDLCPYCRQQTAFSPLPPSPPPPAPIVAEPAGPRRRPRRALWVAVAGLAAVAVAGTSWFLATRSAGGGTVCSELEGQTPVIRYLRLIEAFEEEAEPADWTGFLAEATRVCSVTLQDLLDLRPGLADAPPDVEWHIGPQVASWEEEKASEMVLAAQAMVAFYAGEPLPDLTVHMDVDRATLAQALGGDYDESYELLGEGTWFGGSGAIYVNLSQNRLHYPYDYSVVAHEIMHVFQRELSYPAGLVANPACPAATAEIGGDGPAWIIEGTAEQIGWAALVDSPYWPLAGRSADPIPLFESITAPGYAAGMPLQDLEGWGTWHAQEPTLAYALAFAGGAALEDLAGRGTLFDYFRRLGNGECWPDAFAAAFGLTPGEFYPRFEADRPVPEATG